MGKRDRSVLALVHLLALFGAATHAASAPCTRGLPPATTAMLQVLREVCQGPVAEAARRLDRPPPRACGWRPRGSWRTKGSSGRTAADSSAGSEAMPGPAALGSAVDAGWGVRHHLHADAKAGCSSSSSAFK
jgi:hypothetical protein